MNGRACFGFGVFFVVGLAVVAQHALAVLEPADRARKRRALESKHLMYLMSLFALSVPCMVSRVRMRLRLDVMGAIAVDGILATGNNYGEGCISTASIAFFLCGIITYRSAGAAATDEDGGDDGSRQCTYRECQHLRFRRLAGDQRGWEGH